MVVDDEPANIRMMERLLGTADIVATGFTNPEEALLELRERSESYDLLITDLTMPEMTGIDLIEALRTFDRYIPVVVYTGYGDERSEARALAAGARMMLRKPVTRRVLTNALVTLVREGYVETSRARRSGDSHRDNQVDGDVDANAGDPSESDGTR